MRPETLALVGQVFGRFTVLEVYRCGRKTKAKCACSCGNVAHPTTCSIKSGKSKSCGCARIEKSATHRQTKTKFYRTWASMKRRCRSEHHDHAPYYRDKGITVCDDWSDFENFRKDMYELYVEHAEIHGEGNTTLERLDIDRGYSKENCKWATRSEQMVNRNLRKPEVSGVTGVHFIKSTGRWKAVGYANYREIRLGNYEKLDDAIAARKKFEMERDKYYD